MFNRHGLQIDSLKTADIDRRHSIALGIDALGVGMDAAGLAETMIDRVLVELVAANAFVRREQAEFVAGYKLEQRTLARADGAVARHRAGQFAFNLEFDVAAVTTALVVHACPPRFVLDAAMMILHASSFCSKESEAWAGLVEGRRT